MSGEKHDMSGILFKNTFKKSEKQPDYTGTIVIDDEEFGLAAWIKDGKKGKFMSLGVTRKDGEKAQAKPKPEPEDDDLPF